MLDLEEVLRQHDEVHRKLESDAGEHWTPSDDEWPAIEDYMGVFERIELLIERKILDIETVDRLYSYRVINIVRNAHIRREKLSKKAQFWSDFFQLWESLQGQKYWETNLAYLEEPTASRARPPGSEGAP